MYLYMKIVLKDFKTTESVLTALRNYLIENNLYNSCDLDGNVTVYINTETTNNSVAIVKNPNLDSKDKEAIAKSKLERSWKNFKVNLDNKVKKLNIEIANSIRYIALHEDDPNYLKKVNKRRKENTEKSLYRDNCVKLQDLYECLNEEICRGNIPIVYIEDGFLKAYYVFENVYDFTGIYFNYLTEGIPDVIKENLC